MVDANDTSFNQSAVLMSPPYNRSRDWHSKCLRFRYMLRGAGKKTLTIYQKTSSYREIPIWISKHNTGHRWIYGQVALSSVSNFQVTIRADLQVTTFLHATSLRLVYEIAKDHSHACVFCEDVID